MADERIGTPEHEVRNIWAWTELFRTFQVALDPKKLLLAAAGIVAMFAGWWVLAIIFMSARTEPKSTDYPTADYVKEGVSEADAAKLADRDFQAAHARYRFLYSLAGRGEPDSKDAWKQRTGSLRAEPWHEDRGPNPFLLVTGQTGRQWEAGHFWDWFLTNQAPFLIEPLVKILRPILLLLKPEADGWNRIYLLLVTFWTLLVWALFGGAITRLAAVQLAGKDRPSLVESIRFVLARYLSYLSAPLVPLVFVALIVLLSILYGFLHLIPVLGDVLDSVAWPIMLLLGFAQAVLLIGLVGYPLMYATVSAEGSDTFDALSRSYNYVFQAPWNYIWYCAVAVLYGAVLVFFIGFMGSLVVYLTKWSVDQTPGTGKIVSRDVDNLFAYAPTSFGWRDLLVDVPELESPDQAVRDAYMSKNFWFSNYLSSFFVSMWVGLVFLMVIGFGYSYFFSAGTMIYLLLRRKVDETEMDEVYLEEDEADEPLLPPPSAPPPSGGGTGTPLQMVEAPVLRTPPPAPAPAPPVPAASEPTTSPTPTPAPPDKPASGNGSPS